MTATTATGPCYISRKSSSELCERDAGHAGRHAFTLDPATLGKSTRIRIARAKGATVAQAATYAGVAYSFAYTVVRKAEGKAPDRTILSGKNRSTWGTEDCGQELCTGSYGDYCECVCNGTGHAYYTSGAGAEEENEEGTESE